jgi:hypothetical protein
MVNVECREDKNLLPLGEYEPWPIVGIAIMLLWLLSLRNIKNIYLFSSFSH